MASDDYLPLREIQRHALELASRIHAPPNALANFGGMDPDLRDVTVDKNGYHLSFTERGAQITHQTTKDLSELLYWIFKSVTSMMASKWEVEHRVKGIDSRRLRFSQQMQLLAQLDIDMVIRWSADIGRILREHAFDDRIYPWDK